ncbi:heparinase II/III family protein [Chroococcidiopsis sp. CCMEE 29]|uniref:heparinase II/III domain-containing protein n=1 Tax=Chroococcidiopsis sp. CCMEE 29 TaxID=155894 RepID=UPI002021D25F|nr:heparinase II/III family protein [Chroococcidiopsis sp. CCMEE 29]
MLVQQWYNQLREEAQQMLTEPPVEYKLYGSAALLKQSRAALHRISTLAGLYRLDRDSRWSTRARSEMLTVAAFPDWNPAHFLDTAEMTTAVAIGYDWLYDRLSVKDRATIRRALVEKGLKQGLNAYTREPQWTMANHGVAWNKVNHNWNQVCNGGMVVGTLAIADEEPELAVAIINEARKSIVKPMRKYVPDGGYQEGPDYWNYGTRYNVFFLAAIQLALGTDFSLTKMPGFADTGLFRMHTIGPLGQTFNYSDSKANAESASQMLWLARTLDRPIYNVHERLVTGTRPDIFHLLWSSEEKSRATAKLNLSLDYIFRNVDVALFRSAWEDAKAIYIGFKGGDNKVNHSHLDLGTFVLDGLGERWALDLGPDDYNLPGYFSKQKRWTYYRVRTESHNTLIIDNEAQKPSGRAPLIAYLSTTPRAFAVADLTDGYKSKLTQAWRGIALLDRRQVLVQDEIKARELVDIVWNFHTRARVEARDNQAILTQNKMQFEARILSPQGAHFEVISGNPAPPPQAQQPDVCNLRVRLPKKIKDVRIAVLLTPGRPVSIPKLEPLEEWVSVGKLK